MPDSKTVKMLRRLRARSWLMATRMRSGRLAGSSTGPSPASAVCISRMRLPLARTLSAISKVRIHLLHFASRQAAVQVIGKARLYLLDNLHRASSPRDISIPASACLCDPRAAAPTMSSNKRVRAPAGISPFPGSLPAWPLLPRTQSPRCRAGSASPETAPAPAAAPAPRALDSPRAARDRTATPPDRPACLPIEPACRRRRPPYFLLDRDLLLLMPHPPTPLVRGFTQRDAVDPRTQRRLAMKSADAPEHLDEDFLRQVGGVSVSCAPCARAASRSADGNAR